MRSRSSPSWALCTGVRRFQPKTKTDRAYRGVDSSSIRIAGGMLDKIKYIAASDARPEIHDD